MCLSALCLLVVSLPATATLRCSGGIVEEGDSASEVRDHCGPPDHIEAWQGQPPAMPGAVWFYDRGTSRLLRLLRFRAQRLVRIDSDGYGFGAAPVRSDCRPGAPVRGWSAYRLLVACGAPATRTVIGHIAAPPSRDSTKAPARTGQRLVYRERWHYPFGPRTHMREITLDNAIVTSIRTREHGA
ncbi:MAG: DUF2845 domain-containing protein [Algiphilus sp.]